MIAKEKKEPVLRVKGLRKHYGTLEAVKGISFEVCPDEVVGLLGMNGAGKTTTISMVLGVLVPTAGAITIGGIELAANRSRALACTNFAAVYAPLPGNLTVYENLRVFGLLYGVKDFAARVEKVLADFELGKFRNVKCGLLSSGEQTRAGLAKAMLNQPRLLLLDEPTASIDPASARDIRQLIRSFAGSGDVGVLWTSHNMYEVEEVCDRVMFLSQGEIVLEGNPKELPGQYGKRTLEDLFVSVAREPLDWGSAELMKLSRLAAIPLRQFYLYRGSTARVLPLFAWVTIDMVLWGFMTKFLSGMTQTNYRFVPALLGAVLFWDFMIRVMQGVTTAFFEDVWSRNFLNVFASPITVPEYIGGLLATSIGTSLVGLIVMIVVATLAFGLKFAAYGAMLVPFVLVLFLFGMALGVAAIAIVLRLGPAAEWFVWPIPALLAPFAAVYYPLSTLPAWIQRLSRLLPATYVFEGMRAVVAGRVFNANLLVVAFALSVVYILLAYWIFARVFRYAVETGLIARYSAETVS